MSKQPANKTSMSDKEKEQLAREQVKRARARLQKRISERNELTNAGKLKKYRSHILILFGLVIKAYFDSQIADDRNTIKKLNENAKKTNDEKAKQDIDAQIKGIWERISNVGNKFTNTFVKPYVKLRENEIANTSDEKRKKNLQEKLDKDVDLLDIAIEAIIYGKFK